MADVRSRGKHSLMVVRGKELVHQTARRLAADGIDSNIMQGANTVDNGAPITIASISTLYRRKNIDDFALIVIDEAHLTRGGSYKWLLDNTLSSKILAVTATPYHKEGMRHIADKIVYPISIVELQAQGYLVPGKYFAVQNPDLTGIKKIGDDYDQAQLAERMEATLNGDAVKEWWARAGGRPTIIFAVNIAHSYKILSLYRANGIAIEHVDADTPDEQRLEVFNALRSGRISAVCNVGVLTTGVDLPEVSCLQVMRPTMSKALWFQMLGRGTRISNGKSDFLVLDHSSNTMKHGMIEDEEIGNIDPLPKKKAAATARTSIHECPDCLAIFRQWPCPNCGAEKKKTEREIKEDREAELKELTRQDRETYRIKQIIATALHNDYKKGWCKYQLEKSFGEKRGLEIYVKLIYPMDWNKLTTPTTNF